MAKKMKRKDFEQVNDDFSDFSLASPATKIRRLDFGFDANQQAPPYLSGLSPILEEDGPVFEQQMQLGGGPVIEELLPCDPVNDERAIVLFKPMNTALVRSPSSFSVSPDIISGFKNQFWSRQSPYLNSSDGEEASQSNKCLAVVPWVPAQDFGQGAVPTMEVMDAEDVGEAMEIEEDNNTNIIDGQLNGPGEMMGSESLLQWQQQHCMTPPQLPQNTSTPVVWYQ